MMKDPENHKIDYTIENPFVHTMHFNLKFYD